MRMQVPGSLLGSQAHHLPPVRTLAVMPTVPMDVRTLVTRANMAQHALLADDGTGPRPRSSSKAPSRKAEKAKGPALQQLPQRVSVMPGVGPKYEQLMQAHDICTVSDLLKVHIEAHGKQMEVTQRFLKETVGINNQGCLRNITQYLQQKQQELEQQLQQGPTAAVPSWLQPKVTLSVEGNISAGKSTFLRILEGNGLLDTKLQVVPEPVEKWQNVGVGKDKVNLLMEFYKAPERFAYTFQNYVFLTRMMQERESYTAAAMCRLLERSVFSDRMVFVRSVHAAHYMSDTELEIYNSWFDPVLNTLPTLVPNGFIYLRASPKTCHKRLKLRAREEETTVKLDYLQDLHSKHEDWLWDGGDPLPAGPHSDKYIWVAPTQQALVNSRHPPSQSSSGTHSHLRPGVQFSIHNSMPDMAAAQQHLIHAARLPPVPPELDRAIRFLDTSRGTHMHPLLNTIPALVLDCDTDVDVERDEAYKRHVADQVSRYCDYVRQYMVARGQAVVQQQQGAAVRLNDGIHFPPAGRFNGYSLEVKGTTLYMDSKAPLVAYATREGQQLASAEAQGLSLTDLAASSTSTTLVMPAGVVAGSGSKVLHASCS